MPASDALLQDHLNHEFGITTYTPGGTKYVGLHIASTLASGASTGDGSISMDHEPKVGAKLIIGATDANAETHYVESVSGTGPYTVDIEDSGGTSSTLANDHTSGQYVTFEPSTDDSDILEPSGGSYARVSVTNDDTEWSISTLTIDNDNDIQFAKATADWGCASHVVIYDASTGGTLRWTFPLDAPNDIQTNAQFKLGAGDLDTSGYQG